MLVPPRWIHRQYLTSLELLKTPRKGRLNYLMSILQGTSGDLEARLKAGRPCTHPDSYQHHCYKTSYHTLPGWYTTFQGISLLGSAIAWQRNQAILPDFTQNSVSKIWFGTGAWRLSFQHQYLTQLSLNCRNWVRPGYLKAKSYFLVFKFTWMTLIKICFFKQIRQ